MKRFYSTMVWLLAVPALFAAGMDRMPPGDGRNQPDQPGSGGGTFVYDTFLTTATSSGGCVVYDGLMTGFVEGTAAIVIPSTVQSLADGALAGNGSVTSIDASAATALNEIPVAFAAGCESLVSVSLSGYVTRIGASAFTMDASLSSFTAAGVSEIGTNAFYGCTSLVEPEPVANPGTIGIVEPYPLEAKAGTTVRFAFSRADGDGGSIAVKVKTQSSTALVGTSAADGDLKYTNTILTWADGDSEDKYVDVPVYASGVGKTFRFKLSTLATGAYAGNTVPTLESNKIYIPIVGATPGTIAVSAPDPFEAHENSTWRVTFSRIGGSDGSIAVKVKSQTSTATLRSDETLWGQVGYVKKILEWDDGDTTDRYVDVPIYSNGAGLMFRLKLSTLATGVYQGNLVPQLEQAKIYVPIVE